MVQDGMLHCANSMVHSKALDEQYNRLKSHHFPCIIHQLKMPKEHPVHTKSSKAVAFTPDLRQNNDQSCFT